MAFRCIACADGCCRWCSSTANWAWSGRAQAARDVDNIVVLQADDRQFGLVVDEINDTEEIVVKPLGKQLKGISCFAGATIMGDGQVALILDVLGIAQMASVVSRAAGAGERGDGRERGGSRRPGRAGCCSAAPEDSRLAVPLSAVARLEEFPRTWWSVPGSDEVVQYRGEIMPLVRISRLLQGPEVTADPLQVVVFSGNGRSLGLVVDRIEDITDEAIEVRDQPERLPAGLGRDSAEGHRHRRPAAGRAARERWPRHRRPRGGLSHAQSNNSARFIWTACCLASRWRRCRR